ncbi:MAG TPA: hypothetical protein DEA47_03200 [Peptococcaceae bacterium]|nr:MAG: Sporulation protein YhbH [Clostridia bacterium 41_269]HBT20362.1 hypothetical protein [Peptococcaceae bacterium]
MRDRKRLRVYSGKSFIVIEGSRDWMRHQEILKDLLEKKSFEDIYEEEFFVEKNGKTLRIPVSFLREYGFRFDSMEVFSVGLDTELRKNASKGKKASPISFENSYDGDSIFFNFYQEEIFSEDIKNIDFKDWGFSQLNGKGLSNKGTVQGGDIQIVSHGGGCLDRRRSIVENLKRNARGGLPRIGGFYQIDFRYRMPSFIDKDQKIGFIFILDVSASMDLYHMYLARMMFNLTSRFLKTKCKETKIIYIVHNTRAKIVDERIFFQFPSLGGTRYSSAYELALKIIERDFNNREYRIFVIHLTDGNNLSSDNSRSRHFLERLLKFTEQFGYGEILKENRQMISPSFFNCLKVVKSRKLMKFRVDGKKQALSALKRFFNPSSKG